MRNSKDLISVAAVLRGANQKILHPLEANQVVNRPMEEKKHIVRLIMLMYDEFLSIEFLFHCV